MNAIRSLDREHLVQATGDGLLYPMLGPGSAAGCR
jgi:hypothetical protein